MEVSFDSSTEEEEDYLNIVIEDVCSVLDMEQGTKVVANPLFTEESDSEEMGEVEMIVEPDDLDQKAFNLQENSGRAQAVDCDRAQVNENEGVKIGEDVSVEDYVYVQDNENSMLTYNLEVPGLRSKRRSRSNSFSLDVAPNRGLPDDHENGRTVDDGHSTQEIIEDGFSSVGSLVWAKMRGYPSWPAIVVPDPVTGMSRKTRGTGRKKAELSHVLFLEYSNEVAWLPQDQVKLFTSKAVNKMKGRSKALVRAVEFANSLSSMTCMDRIRSITEYQQNKLEEEIISTKEDVVDLNWAKLSMNPVVLLKRVNKLKLTPVVNLKRIISEVNSKGNINDLLEDSVVSNVNHLSSPDTSGWCEGHLVWARVQGYPFWPAVIVREQTSESFSSLDKAGLMRLHVIFLAYQKQHAWLAETSVVPFLCPDQFKTILKSVDKKSHRNFLPSKRLAPKYSAAVKVAMELLHTDLDDRVEFFHAM